MAGDVGLLRLRDIGAGSCESSMPLPKLQWPRFAKTAHRHSRGVSVGGRLSRRKFDG